MTEGLAGTENPCLAVAEHLTAEPHIFRIRLRQPWKFLSPYLGFARNWTFLPPLNPPWPDILITSGRKAIAASLYIKRASQGRTRTLHIQDPRISPKYFDHIAVPAHDSLRGDNVIVTIGAPSLITPEKLNAARHNFPEFENLPSPRVAVLIGGNSRAHRLTPAIINKFSSQLNALDASLMITCSRRTGEHNVKLLRQNLTTPRQFFWDGTGTNPYLGMLAWADYIIVTNDSVSMLCDAASSGKPVFMMRLDGGGRRLNQFHQNLIDAGIVRNFDGKLTNFTYNIPNDAARIANTLKSTI
jgi:hypothetical protein